MALTTYPCPDSFCRSWLPIFRKRRFTLAIAVETLSVGSFAVFIGRSKPSELQRLFRIILVVGEVHIVWYKVTPYFILQSLSNRWGLFKGLPFYQLFPDSANPLSSAYSPVQWQYTTIFDSDSTQYGWSQVWIFAAMKIVTH